jgi:hypothetical protein
LGHSLEARIIVGQALIAKSLPELGAAHETVYRDAKEKRKHR